MVLYDLLSIDNQKELPLYRFRALEQRSLPFKPTFQKGQKGSTADLYQLIPSEPHSVERLYCPLRWILKRQFKKVDSPIHYKASRITFSSKTEEPCETQFPVLQEMETIWHRLANSHRLCTPH